MSDRQYSDIAVHTKEESRSARKPMGPVPSPSKTRRSFHAGPTSQAVETRVDSRPGRGAGRMAPARLRPAPDPTGPRADTRAEHRLAGRGVPGTVRGTTPQVGGDESATNPEV